VTRQPAAPTRRPATAPRPEPLSRRNQISQDISVALGPGLQAVNLAGDLRDAHVITHAWTLLPLLWAAVPLAVYTWHKTARPPLPPPASRARRALTRAGTALTITLAAAATAAIVILIARHRLTWWASWPITPACFAIIPVLSARNAARNYQPEPARPPAQEGPDDHPGTSSPTGETHPRTTRRRPRTRLGTP
jgi:hypothetical protein